MDTELIRTLDELAALLRIPKAICYRVMYYEPLRAAIEYMIAHAHASITLRDVASAVNMERTSLSRCFRRKLKVRFCVVARALKVADARALLLKSDRSIELVAIDLGYCSVSTFARNFKSLTGCTPSSYRVSCFTEREGADMMRVVNE